MKRSKLNYWVDMCIGAAFVASAVSGLVFLLPVGDGGVLGVSYRTWDTVHTWASLAMIGGVGAHLLLHWKWLVTMTKRMLSPRRDDALKGGSTARRLTRRRFLGLGLGAAAAATIAAAYSSVAEPESTGSAAGEPAGLDAGDESLVALGSDEPTGEPATQKDDQDAEVVQRRRGATPREDDSPAGATGESTESPDEALAAAAEEAEPAEEEMGTDDLPAEDDEPDSAPEEGGESEQPLGVACPYGLVDDPFPGRCRRYVDGNDDGLCDYSVLGSGSNHPRA